MLVEVGWDQGCGGIRSFRGDEALTMAAALYPEVFRNLNERPELSTLASMEACVVAINEFGHRPGLGRFIFKVTA